MHMGTKYNQLTSQERDLLGIMLAKGKSYSKIAINLGRNKSTISREINRNGSKIRKKHYLPHKAQSRSAKKRQKSYEKRKKINNAHLRDYVSMKLKSGWSPELISGRIALDGNLSSISHETIYQWIYNEAPDYRRYLTRKHAKRWVRGRNKKTKKIYIPSRLSISMRPPEIGLREEPGHWESDTMAFQKKGPALQVIIERKCRLTKIRKIEANQAKNSSEAIISCLKHVPLKLRKSITYDNGRENVRHLFVNSKLKVNSYFCHPHSAWEKGSVENTIGLIRRFFPKRRVNGYCVSEKDVEKVENWLNNRPRKCLGFKTPNEVYKQSVALHP